MVSPENAGVINENWMVAMSRYAKTVGLVVGGALLLSMVSLPAQAGVLCDATGGIVCGRVQNLPQSASDITVYDNWQGGNTPAGTPVRLAPDSHSNRVGIKDADGFCIPAGRTASVGLMNGTAYPSTTYGFTGCMKIRDNQLATVTVH